MKHTVITITAILVVLLLALSSHFVSISTWYFVAVGVIWTIIVFVGSFFITSNYHIKAYCSNPYIKENHIAITFDDGPHPTTMMILDILRKHQAKATFFCIGKNAETHPDIMERIVNEGHTIGNHSYSHSHLFDFFRKNRVVAELRQTDFILEKFVSRRIRFFRPPYGVTTPSIRRALEVTGHHVIGWNIRSLDTVITDRGHLFKRIQKRISPGGIILLHDTKMQTVNMLDDLLEFLHDNKYEIVPLEQLLNIKAYEN